MSFYILDILGLKVNTISYDMALVGGHWEGSQEATFRLGCWAQKDQLSLKS